jgi:hypothetical protein
VDEVNKTGGTTAGKVNACKSGRIARPRGAILEAQFGGGGTNTDPCMEGTILGAEVGEGTVVHA